MQTYTSFDQIVSFVHAEHAAGRTVYCRYSQGAEIDARHGNRSTNHVTGAAESGLSVNNLNTLDYGKGATAEWIAQQMADYAYMLDQGNTGTHCWLLRGIESGRGADNEPVVRDVVALGIVSPEALDEARAIATARADRESKIRRIKGRIGMRFNKLPQAEQDALVAAEVL